jgi:hypothetical protein
MAVVRVVEPGVVVPARLCRPLAILLGHGIEWVASVEGIDRLPPDVAELVRAIGVEAEQFPSIGSVRGPVDQPISVQSEGLSVSAKEAARLLNVTPRRILQLTEALGSRKTGGRWAFDPEKVRRYAEKSR